MGGAQQPACDPLFQRRVSSLNHVCQVLVRGTISNPLAKVIECHEVDARIKVTVRIIVLPPSSALRLDRPAKEAQVDSDHL